MSAWSDCHHQSQLTLLTECDLYQYAYNHVLAERQHLVLETRQTTTAQTSAQENKFCYFEHPSKIKNSLIIYSTKSSIESCSPPRVVRWNVMIIHRLRKKKTCFRWSVE